MKGYVKFLTAPPHVNSNLFFFFHHPKSDAPFLSIEKTSKKMRLQKKTSLNPRIRVDRSGLTLVTQGLNGNDRIQRILVTHILPHVSIATFFYHVFFFFSGLLPMKVCKECYAS